VVERSLPQAQVIDIPKTPAVLSGDEVDQMIHQYMPPAITAAPLEIKPNFADDVKAIGGLRGSQETLSPRTAEEASYKQVKVKKGDVLEKIARLNHVTVDEIMKANQMTNTRLKIGQVLKIPTKNKTESTTPPLILQEPDAKYYTMKNGDNLWAIAVKHQMKMEDLLKLNNLTEEKARKLKAGDQIRIK
jgi:LysM repeat protein